MLPTDLESNVIRIGLSRGEPARILEAKPSGLKVWLQRVAFGARPARPLADPRLEALRAMSAALRKSPEAPSPKVLAGFLAVGWPPEYVEHIRTAAAAGGRRDARIGETRVSTTRQAPPRPAPRPGASNPARQARAPSPDARSAAAW